MSNNQRSPTKEGKNEKKNDNDIPEYELANARETVMR
jgi:hypothetical protein